MTFSIFSKPKQDRPKLALILLVTGVFTLASQDTAVKYFTSYTTFWQFQTIRSFFLLCIIFTSVSTLLNIKKLMPQNLFAVFIRSLMLAICMIFFFGGSNHITAAQMGAGLYTYPLFVTLLAGPLLGEKIGKARVFALVIGTFGSMVLLNPLSHSFNLFQLMPITAGFFYALNIIILRKYCRFENPLALVFSASIIFLFFGIIGSAFISLINLDDNLRDLLPFLLGRWPSLTLLIIMFCLVAAVLNLIGNICLSRAYQTAESSWLAPLDFSYLLFLTLWANLILGEIPTSSEIIGMVFIILAGSIIGLSKSSHKTGET